MKRSLRKFCLATHVAVAVGWIGGVSAYLVLVVAAMTSGEPLTLRAAWIAMELIGWYLIVPLALTSLVTGLVMATGTQWGLFRHYWVLISLALTTAATAVLLQHMPAVSALARAAAQPEIGDGGALRSGLRGELLHAGVGLLVLLVIQVLNVYKPLGLTRYGRQHVPQRAFAAAAPVDAGAARESTPRTQRWVRILAFHAIGLTLLLVIVHLAGGGLGRH